MDKKSSMGEISALRWVISTVAAPFAQQANTIVALYNHSATMPPHEQAAGPPDEQVVGPRVSRHLSPRSTRSGSE